MPAAVDSPVTRTRSKTLPEKDLAPSSPEYDSSSDDEAPEEESVGASAAAVKAKEQEQKRLAEEAQRKEKQRRREQQQKFEKQQQEKKEREEAKKQYAVPDVLPEDVLNALAEEEEQQPQRSHVRYDEDLDRETQKEFAKQMKAQKLKMARQMQKTSERKGPVTVKVLDKIRKTATGRVLAVPKAESRIVNNKDKWLKRKSLAKR